MNTARRTLAALAALACWRMLSWMIGLSPDKARPPLSAEAWLLGPSWALMTALAAAFALSAGGRNRRAGLWSALAFALVFLAWEGALRWHGQDRDQAYIVPIAALFAYACAGLAARPGADADEAGWDAACAVIGAAYVMAGLTKLWRSGPAWLDPSGIQVNIASQVPSCTGLLKTAREWMSHSSGFARFSAAATVVLELGGTAMIWPRLRRGYVTALFGLHVMIFLGMGIAWPEQSILLAAALLPERLFNRRA